MSTPPPSDLQDLAGRLAVIREQMAAAARRGGRPPEAVKLVAVGKTFPVPILERLVAAGQHRLGENRVQEAEEKIPGLPPTVEWHLVGHLQSNKAVRAAGLFHWIHSLDSARLARRLSEAAEREGRALQALVQVDLAGGAGRSGVAPGEVAGLVDACQGLRGVRVRGLMTIPPRTPTAEGARPFFRQVRRLAAELADRGLLPGSHELSMGMSGDFQVAVEEGATMVRVGTALLGPRAPLSG